MKFKLQKNKKFEKILILKGSLIIFFASLFVVIDREHIKDSIAGLSISFALNVITLLIIIIIIIYFIFIFF
jgi:hypothetical protein